MVQFIIAYNFNVFDLYLENIDVCSSNLRTNDPDPAGLEEKWPKSWLPAERDISVPIQCFACWRP
ncbi:MAG: hypothetical protein ACOC5H_02225, partial [Desulfovermiculus sp.]